MVVQVKKVAVEGEGEGEERGEREEACSVPIKA